jgi:hypothetical protein
MFISIMFHSLLLVGAIFFVAVTTYDKKDVQFIPKKTVRKQMKQRKLKVPSKVKKRKAQPRLRRRFVSISRTPVKITIPEMVGVRGGIGNCQGTGLDSVGFEINTDGLFGGDRNRGSGLEGTFFDLKQTSKGKTITMGRYEYIAAIRYFTRSWKASRFKKYFHAPKQKYATFFSIPRMNAKAAPKAYNVEDVVKPRYWVAYYKGFFTAPETGKYRFCGFGDDLLLVRVKRHLVLDASYPSWEGKFSDWHSRDKNSRKYPLEGLSMVIGDWIKLKKGEPQEIEVLLGEAPGGIFSCRLLIEQEGKTYKQVPYSYRSLSGETFSGTRPVLPIFKTATISQKIIKELKINPREITADGPIFGETQPH